MPRVNTHEYTVAFHADWPPHWSPRTQNIRYFVFIIISVTFSMEYYAFIFKEEHVFEIFSNFDFEYSLKM